MSRGGECAWDPVQYQRNAGYVPELGEPLLRLLAPQAGERILDLGCGDGALTRHLVDAGCTVVGVDASAEMIAAAQARGIDAHVMDGHALHFDAPFDAVFSNAALHWMTEPDAVLAGVHRALVPGGRFVGEFGGHGNVAHIVAALVGALAARGIDIDCPWYFPTPEDYRVRLGAAGLVVDAIESFARPTPLPGDVGGWLQTFGKPYLARMPAAGRDACVAELVETLRSDLCDEAGRWHADYVRLRFVAHRPAGG
ncbi:MAG: methyltransferase domain-containing protein [Rhodocyclaceae bacterium]|nr:methyltransferase domain-containing protein [Rhodocyclaceae bacterium]